MAGFLALAMLVTQTPIVQAEEGAVSETQETVESESEETLVGLSEETQGVERNYISYDIMSNPTVTSVEAGSGDYKPEGLEVAFTDANGDSVTLTYGTEEWNDAESNVWYSDEENNQIYLSDFVLPENAIRHSTVNGMELSVPFTIIPIADGIPEQEHTLQDGQSLTLHYRLDAKSRIEFTFNNAYNGNVYVYGETGYCYGNLVEGAALAEGDYYFIFSFSGKDNQEQESSVSFRIATPSNEEIEGVLGESYTVQADSIARITYQLDTTGYYKFLYDGNTYDIDVFNQENSHCPIEYVGWNGLKAGTYFVNVENLRDGKEHTIQVIAAEPETVEEGQHTVYADDYAFMKFVPQVSSYYNFYSVTEENTIGMILDSTGYCNRTGDGGEGQNFRISDWLEAGEEYYLAVVYMDNHSSDMDVVIERETGIIDISIKDNNFNHYYYLNGDGEYEPTGLTCILTYGDRSTELVTYGTPEWEELEKNAYYTDWRGNVVDLQEIESGNYYRYFVLDTYTLNAEFTAAVVNEVQGEINTVTTVKKDEVTIVNYDIPGGYYRVINSDAVFVDFNNCLSNSTTGWVYLSAGSYPMTIDCVEHEGGSVSLIAAPEVEVGSFDAVIGDEGYAEIFKFVPAASGNYAIYSIGEEDTCSSFYEGNSCIEYCDDYYGDRNFRFDRELEAGKDYYFSVEYLGGGKSGTIQVVIELQHTFTSYEVITEPAVTVVEAGSGAYIPEGLVIDLIAEDGYRQRLAYGTDEWTELEKGVCFWNENDGYFDLSNLTWSGSAIRRSRLGDADVEIPFTVTAVAEGVPGQEYVLEPGKALRFHYSFEEKSKLKFNFTNADDYIVSLYDQWGYYCDDLTDGFVTEYNNYYFVITANAKVNEAENMTFSFNHIVPERVEVNGTLGESITLQPNTITTIKYFLGATDFYKPMYGGESCEIFVSNLGGYFSIDNKNWEILYHSENEVTVSTLWDNEEHSFCLIHAEYQDINEGSHTVYADNCAFLKFVPEVSAYYSFYSEGDDNTSAHILSDDGIDNKEGYLASFHMQKWMEAGRTYYLVPRFSDRNEKGNMSIVIERETGIVSVSIPDSYNRYYQLNSGEYHPTGLKCIVTYGDGSTATVAYGTNEWAEMESNVYYTDSWGNKVALEEVETGHYIREFTLDGKSVSIGFMAANLHEIQGTVGESYTLEPEKVNIISYDIPGGYYKVENPLGWKFIVENGDDRDTFYDYAGWLYFAEGLNTLVIDATYSVSEPVFGLQPAVSAEEGNTEVTIEREYSCEYLKFVPTASTIFHIYSAGEGPVDCYICSADGDQLFYGDSSYDEGNFSLDLLLTAGEEYFIGVTRTDGSLDAINVVIEKLYTIVEKEGLVGETYLVNKGEQISLEYNIEEDNYYYVDAESIDIEMYDSQNNQIKACGNCYKLEQGVYYLNVRNLASDPLAVKLSPAVSVVEGETPLTLPGYAKYYYTFVPEVSGDYELYSTGDCDTTLYYYENGQEYYEDYGGEYRNFGTTRHMEAGETYLYAVQNCYYWEYDIVFGIERVKEIKDFEILHGDTPWEVPYMTEAQGDTVTLRVTYDDDTTGDVERYSAKWSNLVFSEWWQCEDGSASDDSVRDEVGHLLPGKYEFHVIVAGMERSITMTVLEPTYLTVGEKVAVNEESAEQLMLRVETAGVYTIVGPENVAVGIRVSGANSVCETNDYYYLQPGTYKVNVSLSEYDENSYVMLKPADGISVGTTELFVNAGETKVFTFIPEMTGEYSIYSSNNENDTYGYLSGLLFDTRNDDGGEGNNFLMKTILNAGEVYAIGCRHYSSADSGKFDLNIELTGVATDCHLTNEDYVDIRSISDMSFLPTSNVIVSLFFENGEERQIGYGSEEWNQAEKNVRILNAEGEKVSDSFVIEGLPAGRYYRASDFYSFELRIPFDIVEPTVVTEGTYEKELSSFGRSYYTFTPERDGDYDFFFTTDWNNLLIYQVYGSEWNEKVPAGSVENRCLSIHLYAGTELRFELRNQSSADDDVVNFTIQKRKEVKSIELVGGQKDWKFYQENAFAFNGLTFKITFEDDTTRTATYGSDIWGLSINASGVYTLEGELVDSDIDYEWSDDGRLVLKKGDYLFRFFGGDSVIDIPFSCVDIAGLDDFHVGEKVELLEQHTTKKLVIAEDGWYTLETTDWVHEAFVSITSLDGEEVHELEMPYASTNVYYLQAGSYQLTFDSQYYNQTVAIVPIAEVELNTEISVPGTDWHYFVYRFIPDETYKYQFTSSGDWDPYIYVMEDGQSIAEGDNEGNDWNFDISCMLDGGKEYLVVIASRSGKNESEHSFTVEKKDYVTGVTADEELSTYYYGYLSELNTKTYHISYSNGTVVDFRVGDDNWNAMNISYDDYDAEGNSVSYLHSLEEGSYYRSFYIDGSEFSIPFTVRTYFDIELGKTIRMPEVFRGHFEVEEAGYYKVSLSSSYFYYINLMDEEGNPQTYESINNRNIAVYLEAGIYTIATEYSWNGENILVDKLIEMIPGKTETVMVPGDRLNYVMFTPSRTWEYRWVGKSDRMIRVGEVLGPQSTMVYGYTDEGVDYVRSYVAGEHYFIELFNFNSDDQEISLTVENTPYVERIEIVEGSVRPELSFPSNSRIEEILSSLHIRRYFDNGVEDVIGYSYDEPFELEMVNEKGESVTGIYPVGNYDLKVTYGGGTDTIQIKVIEVPEFEFGKKYYFNSYAPEHFKLEINKDVKIAINANNVSYYVIDENGRYYGSDLNSLVPGTYYLDASTYYYGRESYLELTEYAAPVSAELHFEKDTLLVGDRVSTHGKDVNLLITTANGKVVSQDIFYGGYNTCYPILFKVYDEKNVERSLYDSLPAGKYQLKALFLNTEIVATKEFTVAAELTCPALEFGRKYNVAESKAEYLSLNLEKSVDFYFMQDSYGSIQIFDLQTEKSTYYSKNNGIHLAPGRYYVVLNTYMENDTIIFTKLAKLTKIQDTTGKTAAIEYGTWGANTYQTASGNMVTYKNVTPSKPNATLNDLGVLSVSSNTVKFPYYDVSGNRINKVYEDGVSGNQQKWYYDSKPTIQFPWQMTAENEEGKTEIITFNDVLWRLYGFVQKLFFNEDGTPAKTDRNGYLAPGTYNVVIGNNEFDTTVKVDVKLPDGTMYVKGQPKDAEVEAGAKATFGVDVLGSGVAYQWQYSTDGKTWTNSTSTDAKTATISFTAERSFDGRQYRCMVTNPVGTLYSDPAKLTVKAPKNLVTPAITGLSNTATGVQVKWNASEGAEKYRVFYKVGNGGWTQAADVTGTSATVTGLTSGTTYTFLLRCVSADGKTYTSPYDTSKSQNFTYIAQPVITGVSNTATGVEVKWNAVGGAAKYRVFYRIGSGAWTIASGDVTGTSKVVTGLTSGTTYTFTVRCVSEDGKTYISTYDAVGKSITYKPVATTLVTPAITEITNTTTGVQVKWNASEGAAKYRVFYKVGSGAWTTAVDTTATNATVVGLTAGNTYTFVIRCVSADGKTYTSPYDTTGSKSITYQPVATNLATPVISGVSNTATGVQVKWNAVSGAAKYRVFYKVGSGAWTTAADTTATSVTVTGLTSGSTYAFVVRCISADGKTYTSPYDTSKSKSITYIAQPVLTGVSNTTNGVEVKWNAVGGATLYRIFYRIGSGSWTRVGGDVTGTSKVVTGLTSGTNYTFTVRCVSADGASFISTYDAVGKSITYQPVVNTNLATPVITAVSNAATGVQVTWNAVSGAAKYRVFYKTGSGSWTSAGDVTGTSKVVTGLTSGTAYSFVVRCVSADGKTYTSAYDTSKSKSITYIAQPVVTGAVNTASGVQVTWNAVPGAAQYRIFYRVGNGSWTRAAGDATGTSKIVTGLTKGTTYTFTVRCVSADGSSFTSTYDGVGKSVTVQ